MDKTINSTLSKRRSVFWLSQNLYDADGNALIDPPALFDALKNLPAGTFWAIIKHDKDPDDKNPEKLKAVHYHIFIRLKDNNFSLSQMSKQLGIRTEQFVLPEKIRHNNYRVKGLDIDAHCVQYMTHQHSDQKAQYSDREIMTSDRDRLEHLLGIEIVPPQAREEKVRALIESIVSDKTSLMQYCTSTEFDPVLFIDKYQKLNNAEKTRIKLHPTTVENRRVIFVSGVKSGIGKTTLSLKLAEQIAIEYYNAPESISGRSLQPFIFAMSAETGWNGYCSQPILILDDIKPDELKKAFGSSNAVKTAFDPHPLSVAYNVKNSIVNPVCEWIIVNSAFDYSEYIQKLQQTVFPDEPITQFIRRFAARFYIADDQHIRFETSPEGFYRVNKILTSLYFPVAEMQRQGLQRSFFVKALRPCMNILLSNPGSSVQSFTIDISRLGISPI